MARKVIAFIFLALFAVPLLLAVTWAVGVTRGAVSPDFIAGVPREAIRELPDLVDDLYAAAQEEGAVTDPQARVWVQAASRVETTPSQLLRDTGIYDWLEQEVSQTMTQLSQGLTGDGDLGTLRLDMRPLKAALASSAARDYFNQLLAQLPQCTPTQRRAWERQARKLTGNVKVPPCNPGTAVPPFALEAVVAGRLDIPDEVPVVKGADIPPGLDVVGVVYGAMWLLFILPGVLLLVGGVIASSTAAGILAWVGGAALCGGLLVLGSSYLTLQFTGPLLSMDASQFDFARHSVFWTSKAGSLLAQRMSGLAQLAVDRLVEPVFTIAQGLSVVGVVLLVLALLVRKGSRTA